MIQEAVQDLIAGADLGRVKARANRRFSRCAAHQGRDRRRDRRLR